MDNKTKRNRAALALSLATGVWVNAVAGNIPPGAAALGYSNCVINEQPNAADISARINGNSKWFSGEWWQAPVNGGGGTPALTNYSTTNEALCLRFTGQALNVVSAPLDFSVGALPVLPGSNGFYVEFDVQLSDNGSDHWPAVWLLPIEHNDKQQDCYPGDPPHFERWMEFDVDEGGDAKYFGPGLTGTVISWTGIWPNYAMAQNETNRVDPAPLDRSQKHTFGGSYDPIRQQTSWWVDGALQMSAGSPPVPAIAMQQHFYLILSAQSHGGNLPYSMYISGVRAYIPLAPPTNLHGFHGPSP